MKLSNIGSKIVNVGETIILPGKEATVSESWRKNDVVSFLIEKGYLATVDKAPAEDVPGTQPQNEGGKEKPIDKMNKAGLVEKCRELGIEVSEEDTKATLIGKIEAAQK